MRTFLFFLCMLSVAYCIPTGQWILLGERKVKRSDKDVIQVSAKQGLFNKVKLVHVEGSRLRLRSIIIRYIDNTQQRVKFDKKKLRAGEETLPVILDNGKRQIRNVTLNYRTGFKGKDPRIQLWGLRDSTSNIPKTNWQHLGSKQVDFRSEFDTIVIGKQQGVFHALQLQVEENDIFIENVVVYFAGGESYSADIHKMIRANTAREVSLKGNYALDKITFRYSSLQRGQKASIFLLGARGKKIATMTQKAEKNWNLLGQANVSQGSDLESIYIYGSAQTISKLRATVRNRKVHIKQAVVYFTDDTSIEIPIHKTFQAGEASRPLELGAKRVVKRIDFLYETKGIDYNQPGVVEVWGR